MIQRLSLSSLFSLLFLSLFSLFSSIAQLSHFLTLALFFKICEYSLHSLSLPLLLLFTQCTMFTQILYQVDFVSNEMSLSHLPFIFIIQGSALDEKSEDYAELPAHQRRKRLLNKIERLQSQINQETAVRYAFFNIFIYCVCVALSICVCAVKRTPLIRNNGSQ